MKKTILLLIVFAALTNVSAQIKVNSSGNVGIGKDPMYKLDVAGDIYFGIDKAKNDQMDKDMPKELSEKNDQLQEQVNELTGLVDKLIGKDADASAFRSDNSNFSITNLSNLAGGVSASLEQNVPNPFNQTTVIHYTLPETCTSAKVLITNSGGKAVKQIPLSATGGKESITIHGGSISVGVYLYTLICDGKPVDTKKMVLTK